MFWVSTGTMSCFGCPLVHPCGVSLSIEEMGVVLAVSGHVCGPPLPPRWWHASVCVCVGELGQESGVQASRSLAGDGGV